MMLGYKNLLLLCSLSFIFVPPANTQQTIVLNTANAPPNATEDFTGIGDRVLTEAFRRLGMQLKIVRLPSERALQNANDGIDDGNFARVAGLIKIYPNLIQVPESIVQFEFIAFSKKHKFQTIGWESVRPYNVGIITGWKILEKNITGTKTLTKTKNSSMLFNLLLADRVDIIVYDKKQGQLVLQELHALKDVHLLEPPFAVTQGYPYLHKKHENLVQPLADTLKNMKTDGTYQKIVTEVLAPLGE